MQQFGPISYESLEITCFRQPVSSYEIATPCRLFLLPVAPISRVRRPLLPHFATPLLLNAVTFLTGEDKRVINTIFLKDQLKSNPKHTRTAQLSLMVLTLIVVKIYEKCENSQHCAAAAATQLPPFIRNLSD